MQYTLVRIGIVLGVLYVIGFVNMAFTEFGMHKKLLDINDTHTIVKITMPEHGKYIDLRLLGSQNNLQGTVTIKENKTMLYKGILNNKKLSFENDVITAYPILPSEISYKLLHEKKTYTLEIYLTNIIEPITLEMIWLQRGIGVSRHL